MAIQDGDIVGDYRVIGLLGSGGMGTVYRIEHRITRRIEAMKVLPLGLASDAEQERRFEREIQVHARLQHPHIAALYNAVRQPAAIALIMEYVEGESLQRILERGALPVELAVRYARQILDALAYGHGVGVVHCDVSPANILITPEGAAKLMDFGIARAATDLRREAEGVAVGSPWYMAPEQVRATGELDGRVDVYAMGAVLFEMLTGRKLFDADGAFAVMRAQVETAPRPPGAYRRGVPAALDAAVLRALAKDPAARFAGAAEFAAAVEKAAMVMRWRGVAVGLALAAVTGGALWIDRRPRVELEPIVVSVPAPPAPVLAMPAPAEVVEEAVPVRRKPSVRPKRMAAPVAVGVQEEVATRLPEAPEVPAVQAGIAAPVAAPLVPLEEEERPAPAVEAVKPRKSGNRFIRAIGKLNPFRQKN
jgi:serine/threonine-protein kinase